MGLNLPSYTLSFSQEGHTLRALLSEDATKIRGSSGSGSANLQWTYKHVNGSKELRLQVIEFGGKLVIQWIVIYDIDDIEYR